MALGTPEKGVTYASPSVERVPGYTKRAPDIAAALARVLHAAQ